MHRPSCGKAWLAWTHATVATLRVGWRPVVEQPLSAILGPRAFGNMCGQHRDNHPDEDSEEIAKQIYDRCMKQEPTSPGLSRSHRSHRSHGDPPAWESLTAEQRTMWRAAAQAHPLYMPVVVPVRQNFAVDLISEPRALDVLLRVLPEQIAPYPLVWVHLSGLVSRDVA
jgi:hypothetical protein